VSALYDRIGRSYVATREEDPRIAAVIHAELGDARTVLNVGAGAGARARSSCVNAAFTAITAVNAAKAAETPGRAALTGGPGSPSMRAVHRTRPVAK
jgi:hypothetical protein